MPIRVAIQQPALAQYRVPVFAELAERPGIDLTLHYGQRQAIPNIPTSRFKAHAVPTRVIPVMKREMLWSKAQVHLAQKSICDVLVLTWDLHYASLVPALVRAKENGVGTILWGHGYSKREASWRSRLRSSVIRLADAILLYNHTTAQRYIDAGIPREKVFVALNALDQAPIQTARDNWLRRPADLAQFQKDHQLDGPVLIFVSRFEPENRIDLLIRATAELAKRWPTLKTVIVGKGDPVAGQLRDLTQSLGIERHVIFTGPIYDEMQIAPWLLSSTAFCYPANIGLSVLHGFGYGLPVVTNDRIESQNPEIELLRHEENGLLYPADDLDALTATLARLIEDPAYRSRLARNAHETALHRASLANMVDGYEAAIRYVAALRP